MYDPSEDAFKKRANLDQTSDNLSVKKLATSSERLVMNCSIVNTPPPSVERFPDESIINTENQNLHTERVVHELFPTTLLGTDPESAAEKTEVENARTKMIAQHDAEIQQYLAETREKERMKEDCPYHCKQIKRKMYNYTTNNTKPATSEELNDSNFILIHEADLHHLQECLQQCKIHLGIIPDDFNTEKCNSSHCTEHINYARKLLFDLTKADWFITKLKSEKSQFLKHIFQSSIAIRQQEIMFDISDDDINGREFKKMDQKVKNLEAEKEKLDAELKQLRREKLKSKNGEREAREQLKSSLLVKKEKMLKEIKNENTEDEVE